MRAGRIFIPTDSAPEDTYESPVALMSMPSDRTLLAHCPDEYCRLELEAAETGSGVRGRLPRASQAFRADDRTHPRSAIADIAPGQTVV
ncbi:hypothetical protein F0U62_17280 [Cystobacter fuscus]|nr:hypothetical protein F0U62_17280 [Cystobacter fuscus]